MTGLGPAAADDNGPTRSVSVAPALPPATVVSRQAATSPQAVLADRSRPLAERVAALAARDGAPVAQGASPSGPASPQPGASTAAGAPVLTRSAIYRSASSASVARLAPPADPVSATTPTQRAARPTASRRALHRLMQRTAGRPQANSTTGSQRGDQPVGGRTVAVQRAAATTASGSATPATSTTLPSVLRSLPDDAAVVSSVSTADVARRRSGVPVAQGGPAQVSQPSGPHPTDAARSENRDAEVARRSSTAGVSDVGAAGVAGASRPAHANRRADSDRQQSGAVAVSTQPVPVEPLGAQRVERSAAPANAVAAGLPSTLSAAEVVPTATPASSAPALGTRAMVAQLASRVVARRVDDSVPQQSGPQRADRVARRRAAVGSPLVGQMARTMTTAGAMASSRSASVQRRVASAVRDAQPTRSLARRVAADAASPAVASRAQSAGSNAVRSGTIGATVAPRASTATVARRSLPSATSVTTPMATTSRATQPDAPAMVTTASGQSVPAAVMDRSLPLAERVAALAGGGASSSTRPVGGSVAADSSASVSRSTASSRGAATSVAGSEAAASVTNPVSAASPVWSLPIAGRPIIARRVERSAAASDDPAVMPNEATATPTTRTTPAVSARRQRSATPVRQTVRDLPARRVSVQSPAAVMRMVAADRGAVSSGNEAGVASGVVSSMVTGPDHSSIGSTNVFGSAMRQRASRSVMRSADARTTLMRSADTAVSSASPATVRPSASAPTSGQRDDVPAAVRDRSLPLAERVAALAGRGAGAARTPMPSTSQVATPTLPVRPAVAAIAGGHAGGVDRSVAPRTTAARGATTSSTRLTRSGGSDRVVPAPLPAPRAPMVTPSSAPLAPAATASSATSTPSSATSTGPARRQPSATPSRRAASVARQADRSPAVAGDDPNSEAPTSGRRTVRSQTAIQRRAMRTTAPATTVVSRAAAPPPAPSRSGAHHTDQIEMTEQLLEALEERILRALERRGGVQRGWF